MSNKVFCFLILVEPLCFPELLGLLGQRVQGNPASVGNRFINATYVEIRWNWDRIVGVDLCLSFRIFG